jgi:uncharacterized membrane protein YkvA (DUF1232 family)
MTVRLAISVVAALVLTWLALVALLMVTRPSGVNLREARAFVPDVVRLIHRLARDPALGRGTRLWLWLLLAYLAMPIDLVPDFIPVLGFADDVIVVAVALRAVVRRAGADALDERWTGSESGLAALRQLAGLDRS